MDDPGGALAAPVAVAAALLVLAGAPKAVAPDDTARALARMGLPSARGLVRAGGAAEVVLGLAAFVVGGPVASAGVALAYAGFTAVVARALRHGAPLESCGCLGRADTPPTRSHLALVTVLALAAGVAAAGGGAPGLPAATSGAPGAGLPLLLATAVATGLAWLVLAVQPGVGAAPPPVRTLPLAGSAPPGPRPAVPREAAA